jgi:outer membrane protein
MKQLIIITLLFLAITAQAQDTLSKPRLVSLEQAVNFALTNNFNQKILSIDKLSSQEKYYQSKRDVLPDLSANVSQSMSNSHADLGAGTSARGSYSISSQMILYNGSQNWNTIRLNSLKTSQEDSKIAQAQNQLTLQVIESFLNILMNDELLKYQKEVEKKSAGQVNQGAAQFNAGQILESDYLLLESQYASDKYNVINTVISRNNALLQLKNDLSLEPSDVLEIIPPDTSLTDILINLPALDEVIKETLAWLPDLQISQQNTMMAALQTRISKGGYMPVLSLGGSASTGYSGGNSAFNTQLENGLNEQVSLTISIPIWNRGKVKSNVKLNHYYEEQTSLQAQQTEYNIRQQLEQEYQNVISAYNRFLASSAKHYAQGEVFRTYGAQFEAGSITAVELLQQQTNYLSALNDYIQSKYSYILNRKVIDVYMGLEIKW